MAPLTAELLIALPELPIALLTAEPLIALLAAELLTAELLIAELLTAEPPLKVFI